jgi:hypothetical protein
LSNAKEIKYNKKFPKKEITFFTKNTFLQLWNFKICVA